MVKQILKIYAIIIGVTH